MDGGPCQFFFPHVTFTIPGAATCCKLPTQQRLPSLGSLGGSCGIDDHIYSSCAASAPRRLLWCFKHSMHSLPMLRCCFCMSCGCDVLPSRLHDMLKLHFSNGIQHTNEEATTIHQHVHDDSHMMRKHNMVEPAAGQLACKTGPGE